MSNQSWDSLIKELKRKGILRSPNVIKSLRRVPRDVFVPDNVKGSACADCPLPIGFGQTASAPLGRHRAVDWAKHGIHNG